MKHTYQSYKKLSSKISKHFLAYSEEFRGPSGCVESCLWLVCTHFMQPSMPKSLQIEAPDVRTLVSPAKPRTGFKLWSVFMLLEARKRKKDWFSGAAILSCYCTRRSKLVTVLTFVLGTNTKARESCGMRGLHRAQGSCLLVCFFYSIIFCYGTVLLLLNFPSA